MTKNFKNCLLLLFLFCFLPFILSAQTFDPVMELAERRIPWLASHLSFYKMNNDSLQDVFEISSKNNFISIGANNVNSAAMGLNWYLERYCYRSMSHLGDNLSPVYPIPEVKEQIRIASPFKYRYALNYCTFNYTMSFYDWKDWQWELDWMALHGVNLMLAPIGMEEVWQQTMNELKFSDKEIKKFLPGPGFNAWWLMGNLEGWGGPLTQNMINRRTHLEKRILFRMKKLGIEPVLQGFYGIVPTSFKKHYPSENIINQGKWGGGNIAFQQPDMLSPNDSLFDNIADIYYKKIKELYGDDIHFFGGDPFHEGGSEEGINIARDGQSIQQVMQRSFPGSTWILQGWQSNPKKEMLQSLDKSKVLIIQLAGELYNDWENRDGYGGIPFIWSTVNNFGGRTGNYGQLQLFINEVERIRESPYSSSFEGIGIAPEGINNNPVNYDLMLELGWHKDKISLNKWIKKYTQYRYGKKNNTLQKAWDLFLRTVYKSYPRDITVRMPASIFCARPQWGIKDIQGGKLNRKYDMGEFAQGVKLFLSVKDSFSESKTYFNDAIDFSRQILSNKGIVLYRKMNEAYLNENVDLLKKYSKCFLDLILLEDSITSYNKNFRLNTWVDNAQRLGSSEYEKQLFKKNALAQITYWGPDNINSGLHDYAYKEWAGLLRSFYYIRWHGFLKKAIFELQEPMKIPLDFYEFETNWVKRTHRFIDSSVSKKDISNLFKKIDKINMNR